MSKYIDLDKLLERWNNMSVRGRTEFDQEIMVAPTIDIVRCKECKFAEKCEQIVVFDITENQVEGRKIDFCSYGERIDNE